MKFIDFMSSLTELHQKTIAPVSREYGLTSAELAILLFLANNPEYDTATEIVQKRHLAKSHVSTSLRSLEEKGLLRKEYRGNDRRTVHLVLEKSSEEIVKKGQAAQVRFYDILTEGIPESEREQFERILEKISSNTFRALEEM